MKKKIVIASVLKPVDDVRSYWKLSQSIAKTNKYEVNIIGNASKKEIKEENITFHSHALLRNQWIKRIILREEILWKILKIKPALLIITTPELLNVALLSRLLTGCRIVYDVQENYYLNAISINPNVWKSIYGFTIRLLETVTRPFVAEYWLAEKCYLHQLNFVRDKNIIVENKAFDSTLSDLKSDQFNVLFSGTISRYGGIERAVTFYKKLLKKAPNSTLNIIGQIHDDGLKKYLEAESQKLPGLHLKISFNPIPHDEMLAAIAGSNLGIIGYESNRVNKEKIPTKLYEYSRYKLPYLTESGTYWHQEGERLGGVIPINFTDPDIAVVLESLKNPSNLFPKEYPFDATWEYESSKIITSLDHLIK